ncbi:MAG: hypothetical protein WC264_02320 [Candidatus Paceibacterota bacterium]|jgi:hypothetical protein
MNIEYKVPNKSNGEASKRLETLKEKLPFIKFPADFEVKLTADFDERRPIHFLVKKEGALNKVSVIALIGEHGEDSLEWEVMTSAKDYGPGGDSTQHMPLEDTESLIKAIEEALYFKPSK